MPTQDAAEPPPGRRLKSWRALAEMDQSAVAQRLGVSQQTVSQIELGTISPRPQLRRAIAKLTTNQVPEDAWEPSESNATELSVAS